MLISALVVGLTLLFLTPIFYYLPKAVLAAIIIVAVFAQVQDTNIYIENIEKYRKLKQGEKDEL